jgi:ribosomal protein S18 acetylase RimI-like enzyme
MSYREAVPTVIREGTDADRPAIYRIRHEVYASELHQHPETSARELRDGLDDYNRYVVLEREGRLIGFDSITPPGHRYSIDKYFERGTLPFPIDDTVFEIRLLTLDRAHRRTGLALVLVYAAYLLCARLGARTVVAVGHDRVLDFYRAIGLQRTGLRAPAGALEFELVATTIERLHETGRRLLPLIRRVMERHCINWRLDVAFQP